MVWLFSINPPAPMLIYCRYEGVKRTVELPMACDAKTPLWRQGDDLHRSTKTCPDRRGTAGLHPGYSWTAWNYTRMFQIFRSPRINNRADNQAICKSIINGIWRLLLMTQCSSDCAACRTTLIATRFRVAVICPIIQVPHCIRVFFYFVWFVFINHIFQFYNEICTYCNIWIITYHKIWILSIMFCFIWSYWIIYFLACLEVSWRVVS